MRLRDLFGRKQPHLPLTLSQIFGDSLVDWRVGDDALCTFKGPCWWVLSSGEPTEGPRDGEINRVTGVTVIDGCQFLTLDRYSDSRFVAVEFVRLERREEKATRFDFRKLLEPKTQPKELERVE